MADAWDDFGEKEETTREGIPRLNQVQKDKKRILSYVKMATYSWPVLALVTSLVGFTSFTATLDDDKPVAGSSAQTLTSEEALQRSLAVETVTEWLSARPSPLPRGRVLAWDGAEIVPQITEPTEKNQDGDVVPWPIYRAHRVSLVQTPAPESNDTVRYYTAVVSIATSNTGPLIVGEPSLIPAVAPSTSTTLEQLWPGAVTVQVSEPVQVAVSNWAKAFASGDGAALKQTIGDPDQTHFYIPLPGFTMGKAEVRAATLPPGAKTSDETVLANPDVLVARVALSGYWPGSKTGSDGSDSKAVLSYDVLVADASSGSPRVVAWAGVGAGLTLEPYGNWVTQAQAEVNESAGIAEPESSGAGGVGETGKTREPSPGASESAGLEHEEPVLGDDDPEKEKPRRRLVDKETGREVVARGDSNRGGGKRKHDDGGRAVDDGGRD